MGSVESWSFTEDELLEFSPEHLEEDLCIAGIPEVDTLVASGIDEIEIEISPEQL